MVTIHPVQTGLVRVKKSQQQRKPGGLVRALLDSEWSDWLPIFAWLIDHPEGPILVDTGDTARTSVPGYLPKLHPYYRLAVDFRIEEREEVGPQLKSMGLSPDHIGTVILTHFHTDHAGGLHHFPNSKILVSAREYEDAKGVGGRLRGYLPHRWPSRFTPTPVAFESNSVGPFSESASITNAGDVLIVPTPGHTPGHVSVIVKAGGMNYFLAGDTSYNQELLLSRQPDGVSPRPSISLKTIDKILGLGAEEDTVYLPTHDPQSPDRLQATSILPS